MNEKGFKTAGEQLKGLGKTAQGEECCFLFIADIARQLTIIADKLDERWDFDKEADDLADEVNTQLERGRRPPADALVEAVKLAVRGHRSDREAWCVTHKCQSGIDNMVGTELGIHIIAVALAAHEKAGSDGT